MQLKKSFSSIAFLRSSFFDCQHSIVNRMINMAEKSSQKKFFSYKQSATTSISHFQNWEKFELRVSKENVPVMKNPPSQHQISKLIVLQPALEISPINQFMVEKLRNTHTTFQNRERQSMYTLGHVKALSVKWQKAELCQISVALMAGPRTNLLYSVFHQFSIFWDLGGDLSFL